MEQLGEGRTAGGSGVVYLGYNIMKTWQQGQDKRYLEDRVIVVFDDNYDSAVNYPKINKNAVYICPCSCLLTSTWARS